MMWEGPVGPCPGQHEAAFPWAQVAAQVTWEHSIPLSVTCAAQPGVWVLPVSWNLPFTAPDPIDGDIVARKIGSPRGQDGTSLHASRLSASPFSRAPGEDWPGHVFHMSFSPCGFAKF